MEADDMMGLGSGTKGYTASAIMRLVDQGKV
jgi:CubicO group peptidase (beta-lactamase class C family)